MWKKIIILLIIITAVAIVLFFMLLSKKQDQGSVSLPFPTAFIREPEGARPGAAQNTDPTIIEQDRESGFVLKMAQELPYYGKNFSLYYDFSSNSFILHLNPLAKTEGNAEFAAFLKKNNIENPSWIKDITILYQSP